MEAFSADKTMFKFFPKLLREIHLNLRLLWVVMLKFAINVYLLDMKRLKMHFERAKLSHDGSNR